MVRAWNPLPPVLRESTRARRGDIVPFIKNDMPVQAKGSIVEIVVGPSAATGAEDGVCVYALLKPFYDGPNAIAVLWKLFCAQILGQCRCPSGMEVSRLLKGKADVLERSEHTPTDDAPTSGRYELLNVFGTPTGEAVSV